MAAAFLRGRQSLSRRGATQQFAQLLSLALAFSPALWRLLAHQHLSGAGLLSDCAAGLLFLVFVHASPRWLRLALLLFWALFQAGAQELAQALHRFPTWQDLSYLGDRDFVANTTAGFNLAYPGYSAFLLSSACMLFLLPLRRPHPFSLVSGLVIAVLLLTLHGLPVFTSGAGGITERYNPLHWFVADGLRQGPFSSPHRQASLQLPPELNEFDPNGRPLLSKGKAKNMLLIILEGIPGLYAPEIRQAMGVQAESDSMPKLAQSTRDAMLIPDFTVHSHQTIRGLYSILCGDFSKLSWDTPKAVELQQNLERAQQCLPAQMKKEGWSTHYLQAAGLGFMGKDRFMPLVGFEQVHGVEWFSEPNPYPFEWGVIDSVFFRGARGYIDNLRRQGAPWMLTLLTVGTHQPYAVTDAIAARYPSRKAATVAMLDEALSVFLEGLRRDGVLDDTLVIVTSDESHGAELGDWVSSWGLGMVLSPEHELLPRIKKGGYGLVDITASVLTYFGLSVPPAVIGRSFFHDYDRPREMLSYTVSTKRWHTSDNLRYECADDGRCLVGKSDSLLGPRPEPFTADGEGKGRLLAAIAATLDQKVMKSAGLRRFQFANGEQRRLPEKINNDWGDNLVGAQYLDFPPNSTVEVKVRVKALAAPAEGIRLKLQVKAWEFVQEDIPLPQFPPLHAGETVERSFSFNNKEARQSFSFYFMGEGKSGVLQMQQFEVSIRPNNSVTQ